MENGVYVPSPETIIALSKELKLNSDKLLLLAGFAPKDYLITGLDEDVLSLAKDIQRLSVKDRNLVKTIVERLKEE